MTNDKQKDRLVELLEKASEECVNIPCNGCKYVNERHCKAQKFVDHILADGWMRPPCKVGDTAYFLIEDTVAGKKYISPEAIVDVCTKGFYTSGHDDSDENGDLWLWSDVGGIVFLDKAKAEEALGGVQG